MESSFQRFPKVRGFASLCARLSRPSSSSVVTFGTKVKLHGSNCSIRVSFPENSVIPQSRNCVLSLSSDFRGFAAWVLSYPAAWLQCAQSLIANSDTSPSSKHTITYFGEWAGPGVQTEPSTEAVLKISQKCFFLFGILIDDVYHSDPEFILESSPRDFSRLFVVPWVWNPLEEERLHVDFKNGDSVESAMNRLNELVEEIEKQDPYIREIFGVLGTGEGVFVTPFNVELEPGISMGAGNMTLMKKFMFKAKSKAHRGNLNSAVEREVLVPSNVNKFVKTFVASGRCWQGVTDACEMQFEESKMNDFVEWILNDVKSESEDELRGMGLTWGNVKGQVSFAARSWYSENCKGRGKQM